MGQFPEIEKRLAPLAEPLPRPRSGDWLAEHPEPGQTFAEYLNSNPVRRTGKLSTIYLRPVGDFTEPQQRIVDLAKAYLAIFFDSPVTVSQKIAIASIPARARRGHPSRGDSQVLTSYILDEVLKPDRPADALAYLALTSADLWPGKGWNFVFGQANLRERIGVWSMYRNGDPEEDFRLCLRRTLTTASHETGHILGMEHCIAYSCLMNGSNHQEEKDRRPMHLCPVCLQKLCWNLQVQPVRYLKKLKVFSEKNGFDAEGAWYEKAMAAFAK